MQTEEAGRANQASPHGATAYKHSLAEAERCIGIADYHAASTHLNAAEDELLAAQLRREERRLPEACILTDWAWVMMVQGEYLPAQHQASHALSLLEGQEGGARVRSLAANVMCNVAIHRQQRTEAEQYSDMALREAQASGDAFALANAWNTQGNLRSSASSSRAALHAYEAALAVAAKLDSAAMTGVICGNLANIYRQRGELARSREYAHRCLDIAEQGDDTLRISHGLLSMALVLMIQGNDEQADACIKRAYLAAELGQNTSVMLRTLGVQAEMAWLRGNNAEARQTSRQILSSGTAEPPILSLTYAILVHTEVAFGDLSAAEAIGEHLWGSKETSLPFVAYDCHYLIGTAQAVLQTARQCWDEAKLSFVEAVRKADSCADVFWQAEARLIHGRALLAAAEYAEAAELLKQAQTIFAKIGAAGELAKVTEMLNAAISGRSLATYT